MPNPDDITEPVLIGSRWHFADGTTLPLVRGGDGPTDEEEEEEEPDPDDGSKPKPDDEEDEPDPEAAAAEAEKDAEKAAAKWKALARKHEAAAKKAEKARKAAEDANASDADKAKNAARAEGEKAARERLAGRLLVSTVKTLAADKMSVPARLLADADAVKRLLGVDLDDVVSEDGDVDEEAISDAIDALIAEEPDLAKKADAEEEGKPKGGKPKAPTGARNTKGKKVEDLSVEEMRAHLAKKGRATS